MPTRSLALISITASRAILKGRHVARAETFADELVPLWEKAKDMYARKLAKIPARVFPGGSKPT
jgi:hypothetical protein